MSTTYLFSARLYLWGCAENQISRDVREHRLRRIMPACYLCFPVQTVKSALCRFAIEFRFVFLGLFFGCADNAVFVMSRGVDGIKF